jgi:two-component system NtrC family sensor kinase
MCSEARRNAQAVQQSGIHHADSLAALARAASSLGHAIATPLNVIAGRAALITMDGSDTQSVQRYAGIIQDQTRAISELLRQLSAFAQGPQPRLEYCSLGLLLDQAVARVQPLLDVGSVAVRLGRVESVSIRTDPAAWVQAHSSLLSVAVAHTASAGSVTVDLESVSAEPPARESARARAGEHACLSACARPSSLPPALLDRPLEPWFSDLPLEQRDAALTLAIAYEVARTHRGWTAVAQQGEGDTRYLAYWPLATPDA